LLDYGHPEFVRRASDIRVAFKKSISAADLSGKARINTEKKRITTKGTKNTKRNVPYGVLRVYARANGDPNTTVAMMISFCFYFSVFFVPFVVHAFELSVLIRVDPRPGPFSVSVASGCPEAFWAMLSPMASAWLRVYRFATGALAPFAARRLARAAAGAPELLARQPERRGHVPDAGGELWVHAASVGELNAAEPLVRALAGARRWRVLITTLTHTGAAEAHRRFAHCDAVRHLFAPLDTTASVARWLDRTRPRGLLLIETEIWPVMLEACRRRSIPVAMVNARISSRAMLRYRRLAGLFRQALAEVDPVLCQDEASRERFEVLGVDGNRIRLTGNLKFDVHSPAVPGDEPLDWQRRWSGRPAWVAGSTHAAEESIVAGAHRKLLQAHPGALLLVVPRHPERGSEAFDACMQAGLTACMVEDWPARAVHESGESDRIDAIVVDRVGVLNDLYQLVDACVICGSLVAGIGGHNLIEPALAGKPILTGIHTADQQAAADGLEASNGLVRVDSEAALADRLSKIFTQPEYARQLAANAGAFASSQRGALDRTLKQLEPWLAKPTN